MGAMAVVSIRRRTDARIGIGTFATPTTTSITGRATCHPRFGKEMIHRLRTRGSRPMCAGPCSFRTRADVCPRRASLRGANRASLVIKSVGRQWHWPQTGLQSFGAVRAKARRDPNIDSVIVTVSVLTHARAGVVDAGRAGATGRRQPGRSRVPGSAQRTGPGTARPPSRAVVHDRRARRPAGQAGTHRGLRPTAPAADSRRQTPSGAGSFACRDPGRTGRSDRRNTAQGCRRPRRCHGAAGAAVPGAIGTRPSKPLLGRPTSRPTSGRTSG